MKKILIFSLAYYPRVGGAEVAIKEITDRIRDIEFHMVTHRFDASAPAQEKIGNVLVHRIGSGSSYVSKILFILRAARFARALDREHHYDALWAMMVYMTLPITLMRLFDTRIPYLLTLQEGDPYEHVFSRWYIRIFLPLLSAGFRHARVAQAISTYLAEWAKQYGFKGTPRVIPNGVDTKHFSQTYPPAVLNELKDTLGKKMGDVFLVTTSRLVKKNAVDDVIRALRQLPTHVRFLIIGSGPDEAMLKKLAQTCGVTERVTFLGHVDHAELPKYLSVSDIFIRPSRSEGMGNSFIEAFAAGLPVIATQEGGIADFLFDEKRNSDKPITGWAVDKDSPKQIAQAVEEIMARSEKVRAVTATARQIAVAQYDWNLIAKRMNDEAFRALFETMPVSATISPRKPQ